MVACPTCGKDSYSCTCFDDNHKKENKLLKLFAKIILNVLIFLVVFLVLYPRPGYPADTFNFMVSHPHFWRIITVIGDISVSAYVSNLIYKDIRKE